MKFFDFTRKCKHKYWTQLDSEGIQYCIECNYARKINFNGECSHEMNYSPIHHVLTCKKCGKVECFHKWIYEGKTSLNNEQGIYGTIYFYKCEYCGEIKKDRVEV